MFHPNSRSIIIKCCDPEKLTSLKALKMGKIRADGTNMARTLGNTPANDLKPKDLATEAKKIAVQYKMESHTVSWICTSVWGSGVRLLCVDRARGPLLVPSRPSRPQFHRGRFLVPEGSRPAPLCLG